MPTYGIFIQNVSHMKRNAFDYLCEDLQYKETPVEGRT